MSLLNRLKWIFLMILLSSCSTIKYIPVTEKEYVTEYIKDTVVIYKPSKDSIFIQTKDTISRLETSLAVSEASISNGYLNHSIKNKDSVKVSIVYKDKIQEKIIEKPVEVYKEVYKTPKWV